MAQIILASASPRRQALLDQLHVCYEVTPANIDESPKEAESTEQLVQRLALEKARFVWQQRESSASKALPVLGADTIGICNETLLLKPKNIEDAYSMLGQMSDSWHTVITAIALLYDNQEHTLVSRTDVLFRPITEQEIAAYWASGEPQDKAGAYAIQGRGAQFVKTIHGSYSGVMGLPIYETAQLLSKAGISTLQEGIL